jgi:hypothetical protein
VAQTWINAALMLPTSALLAAALLIAQAPDLSQIETHRTTKGGSINELASAIEQTALKQAAPLELSEGDINAHLAGSSYAGACSATPSSPLPASISAAPPKTTPSK